MNDMAAGEISTNAEVSGLDPHSPLLELEGVKRHFRQGGSRVEVLNNIDLSIMPGQMVALVGPSGAGKSTLLHIAGLLERPSSGKVRVQGRNCGGLSDFNRARLRRRYLGFVYQSHYLLPEFSALENVMLPQMLSDVPRTVAEWRARDLLDAMGLKERLKHRPSKMSGGEQQRVAIARAVANGPSVLLADEPTGNLDQTTAERVFQQLLKLVHLTRIGALVATHNVALANRMDRILELRDGQVIERDQL
jgi:lipoprotein-releasing system ATP-binding protein